MTPESLVADLLRAARGWRSFDIAWATLSDAVQSGVASELMGVCRARFHGHHVLTQSEWEEAEENRQEVIRLSAIVAGKEAGTLLVVSKSEWEAMTAEVQNLKADNAALVEAGRRASEAFKPPSLLSSADVAEVRRILSEAVWNAEHPGVYLLSEMSDLRSGVGSERARADAAEDARRDALSDSARLRRELAETKREAAESADALAQAQAELQAATRRADELAESFRGEAPDTAEAVIIALGDCLGSPGGVAMAKHARQMETRARECKAERDAAQQRVRELERVVRDLLASADCEWENRREGHDWPEAVGNARALLGVTGAAK